MEHAFRRRIRVVLAIACAAGAGASMNMACGGESATKDVVATGRGDEASVDQRPAGSGTDGGRETPSTGARFPELDINHVLSTGQSLSVGVAGGPPLSTVQPYTNLMFASGVNAEMSGLASFVPLVEGDLVEDMGTTLAVETMSSAMANLATRIARSDFAPAGGDEASNHDILVSAHGISGAAYSSIRKGTAAFALGIAQVRAARAIAARDGKSYGVRVVTTVHGETDHVMRNESYAADLAAWQADYESAIGAVLGETRPVPMLETQMSSWTILGDTSSTIPAAQLAAHVASGGKIVLVGPKYHLAYAADGLHLDNAGYRHLGEDYAKVYRRLVFEGKPWEPLRPRALSRTGKVVTIAFHVPAPPIVLDTTLVSDPGDRGFEYIDDSGKPPAIVDVAVTGPDTVTLTLASVPTGGKGRVRYAYRGGAKGVGAGPKTGPRGNLRDSDGTASRSANPLFNWCVHFDEALP